MSNLLARLRPAPTSLWRNREFNLLWSGQALSGLGSSMSSLAFPLVVLALSGSAVLAGTVGTVGLLVQITATIPAGVLVDRVDRRRMMIWCDTIRLAAFGALGALLLTGYASVPVVLAVAVVEGLCDAPFSTATNTAIRNVVPMEQVSTAMARNEARLSAVNLVGPPLGGVAFSLGRAVPFFADAVSYLASITGLVLIRKPLQQADRPAERVSPLADLVEGLRFTVREPFLRSAIMVGAPLNFAINGAVFGLILVLREHGTPPALIGTVETMLGVGGLLGAVAAGPLMRRFSVPFLIRAIALAGIPLLVLVLPLAGSPLAGLMVGLMMVLAPALNASLFGHLARITPDRLHGRVLSALIFTATTMTAFAPLIVGALVHRFGAAGLVAGIVAAQALSSVVALTAKGLRHFQMPDEPPTAPAPESVPA